MYTVIHVIKLILKNQCVRYKAPLNKNKGENTLATKNAKDHI